MCRECHLCAVQVLAKTTDVTMEHLYEFATDRNASHVARRLLCVIAGRDVMPAQHNSSSMDASAIKANKVSAMTCTYQQIPTPVGVPTSSICVDCCVVSHRPHRLFHMHVSSDAHMTRTLAFNMRAKCCSLRRGRG